MEAALSIAGWLMILATVLPLMRSEHWVVRVFDFPRLQITFAFVVIFLAYLSMREDPSIADQLFLALFGACLAYQLWRMWPYTPLHGKQVKRASTPEPSRTFSVLISNVLMTNRDSGRLRALVRERDPDVVLLVETDDWWQEQLREFENGREHVIRQPQSNTYGMLLYSRFPMIDPRVEFRVAPDVPSIHTGLRLPSGDLVKLHCLHPRPPAPGESATSKERDTEMLLVAKQLEGDDSPAIVVGDLNDVAWSRTNDLFQKISGLLDPRIGRGFFSTFNANWPFVRFPLDHAFVSRHFQLEAFEVLPHVGSDHFPVFARLVLCSERAAAANRPPPAPSSGERRDADDKVSRAAPAQAGTHSTPTRFGTNRGCNARA